MAPATLVRFADRDRALRAEQIVARTRAPTSRMCRSRSSQKYGIGDGQLADLLTLREDRQPAALVVEVLELDRLQSALAKSVVEQESERDPVSAAVLLRDDRAPLVGR